MMTLFFWAWRRARESATTEIRQRVQFAPCEWRRPSVSNDRDHCRWKRGSSNHSRSRRHQPFQELHLLFTLTQLIEAVTEAATVRTPPPPIHGSYSLCGRGVQSADRRSSGRCIPNHSVPRTQARGTILSAPRIGHGPG